MGMSCRYEIGAKVRVTGFSDSLAEYYGRVGIIEGIVLNNDQPYYLVSFGKRHLPDILYILKTMNICTEKLCIYIREDDIEEV